MLRYVVVTLFQVNGKKKEMKQKRRALFSVNSVYKWSEVQSCSVNCQPHVALFQCVCVCVWTCMTLRWEEKKSLGVCVFV